MKLLKKLTMILLAIGMTASFAACDTVLGMLNLGGTESQASENNQTSEVEETEKAGEELSETQFNAAVQALCNANNILVTITDGEETSDGQTVKVSGVMAFADGKMYSEITYTANGTSKTQYTYAGQVNDTYYTWFSTDNKIWDYSKSEAVEPSDFLNKIFMWCNFGYFEFNSKTGEMQFTGLDSPIVNVKAVDGKIVEFRFEETDGDWSKATISCGNATIGELPALD